jgi:hypothetical protein
MTRLPNPEMRRTDEQEQSRNEGTPRQTPAVTRKWSALLKLLAVDGPNRADSDLTHTDCGDADTRHAP